MHETGPNNGSLTIHTGRAGLAARAGHDLVLEAERWSASVDLSAGQVRATVDATSLVVREGHGGVKPLTDADLEEIRRNIAKKVLGSDRHPEIMFVSTAMNAVDDRRWQVDGDLTIAGVTAPVRIPIEINPAPHGVRLTAAVTIAQSSFGIKPFSALMGALQVADQVRIQAEARVPGSG